MTIIARGAEAVIEKKKSLLIKKRIAKGYRHPQLDEKIRKLRTRHETKLLEKAAHHLSVPRVISSDESTKEIVLEHINAKKLAETLDKQKAKTIIGRKLGISIAKLHDADIIHGDLTTSNMLYANKKLTLIDFGLGYISAKIEDKAVDLHVLKEALKARHPSSHAIFYKAFLKGYASSKNAKKVLSQLERVEKRGRYKANY